MEAAATAQTIAIIDADTLAPWIIPKLIDLVRSALLAEPAATRSKVSPPAIKKRGHRGLAEGQRGGVGGQCGQARADRPCRNGSPERGRRPALGCSPGLDERGAEPEIAESHRKRRERDGKSRESVVVGCQQPCEDDYSDEPDGLDRDL